MLVLYFSTGCRALSFFFVLNHTLVFIYRANFMKRPNLRRRNCLIAFKCAHFLRFFGANIWYNACMLMPTHIQQQQMQPKSITNTHVYIYISSTLYLIFIYVYMLRSVCTNVSNSNENLCLSTQSGSVYDKFAPPLTRSLAISQ